MWYRFATNNAKLNINLPDYAYDIMSDIKAIGGRALVVGGAVRDAILGHSPKDIDFEVYNTSYEDLNTILSKYGRADLVGQSFGVIKFLGKDGLDFDFSLPRLDSKAGVGHKDFDVEVRSDLTPDEAASRRDFTINAISYDPITGEIIDPYNGQEDLKNKVLRHTSDAFADDPLRTLRGMQFASRFGFDLAPETAELMRSIKDQYAHLPKERVEMEFKKLVLKGIEPGKALEFLYNTGWSENFPHIHNLKGVPQDSEWHPEGGVELHTAYVMNAAAKIADREGLTGEDREVLIYAALAHDFAKPATTKVMNKKGIDRITSHGHEEAGGPMAREFLTSIGVNSKIINKVVPLVENHLNHIHHSNTTKPDSFVRQLAERLHPANIQELERLIEADHSGRPPLPAGLPEQAKNMSDYAKKHNVYTGKHPNLLQGADVIKYTGGQGSPLVGNVLNEHRKLILENHPSMFDRNSALSWLDNRMQRHSSLINGNDVMNVTGMQGAEIKPILERAWVAQKNGEFSDKDSAINWLKNQGGSTRESFNLISFLKTRA